MRKTYRSKNNFDYWKKRWTDIGADEPMINENYYPLKYSNMLIKDHSSTILEAGCGAGRVLRFYHNKKYKIFGIDFIREAVDKLKKADETLNVKFGNILNLEFKNETFDIVLAFGLYHNFHSNNLIKSLNETHRVLKKNGKLCASFRADNIQELIIDWIRRENNSEQKVFHKLNLKKKEFKNLLETNGFLVENVFNVQNMPFLYKFKFFRSEDHKKFNEEKGRVEGYQLSYLGNMLQKFLLKFFPDNFCNIYVAICSKKDI